jgi:hypothetical protein
LVKIHWRMMILECSQGCYVVKIWPLDQGIHRVIPGGERGSSIILLTFTLFFLNQKTHENSTMEPSLFGFNQYI